MSAVALNFVGGLALLVLCGLFMIASLSKVSMVHGFASTLQQLGLAERLAVPVGVAVIVAEFTVGTTLALTPESPWPRIGAATLVTGFAAAGIVAISTGRKVLCHCVGAGRRGTLGKAQILALPVWLALCVVAELFSPSWETATGALLLTGLLLSGVAWRLFRFLPLFRDVRADRIAFS